MLRNEIVGIREAAQVGKDPLSPRETPPRAFEQFLRQRAYLNNVTPKTLDSYQTAWKAFERSRAEAPVHPASSDLITLADLQRFVVHLRQRGVKPVSCNCWLRAMNAFCKWLHEQGDIPQAVRLRPQKLEKRLLRTHGEIALRRLIGYRPKTFVHWRVYAVVCRIVDTGCRISELLTVRGADFDFGNLLLTVSGKGRKERRVPFSTELRKVLFRFGQMKERAGVESELMFPARDGGKWERKLPRQADSSIGDFSAG